MSEVLLISVKLGNTNVARAGSGPRAVSASATMNKQGEAHGYVAARRAAAKYFSCDENAVEVKCISPGNTCTGKPAIFEGEKGEAS